MTLFLGYFLLLLPKRILPLVMDVTSLPASSLLCVLRWRPGDAAIMSLNLTL